MSNLESSLTSVLQIIREYGVQAPRLVAVSKTVSSEVIRQAYELGQRLFGENRIDVLKAKVPSLPDDIEWHFIGNIQSRKIADIVAYSSMIHSVGSIDKIEKIDRAAVSQNKMVSYLLQVNISQEAVKSGFTVEESFEAMKTALSCQKAKCVGLMTMAPFQAESEELHQIFMELRVLRDQLEQEFDYPLPELSMGMSNDYQIALQEGATLVRVGSAIFKGC
jgi:pyridoxal phosphate enzyme (YggS family)